MVALSSLSRPIPCAESALNAWSEIDEARVSREPTGHGSTWYPRVPSACARSRAMTEARHDVTLLLRRMSAGDRAAGEALLPIVYAELRALAQSQFRSRLDDAQTLQPTALVHEAFLKI